MTEELKPLPCPFCGGKASAKIGLNSFSDAEVVCDLCGASGGLHDSSGGLECDDALAAENEDAAIKAWNTRSPAWRDIESAPRDGTVVLLYGIWAGEIHGPETTPSGPHTGYWRDGTSDYDDGGEDWWQLTGGDAYATWCRPTHWMPLPLPPEETK